VIDYEITYLEKDTIQACFIWSIFRSSPTIGLSRGALEISFMQSGKYLATPMTFDMKVLKVLHAKFSCNAFEMRREKL